MHASLSLDERRRAEQAFAEGRDCVIVSTSALELGVDVGDLDRVIQVNCLFLALDEEELLLAAGLLLAWSRGFVEPVTPPPGSMAVGSYSRARGETELPRCVTSRSLDRIGGKMRLTLFLLGCQEHRSEGYRDAG